MHQLKQPGRARTLAIALTCGWILLAAGVLLVEPVALLLLCALTAVVLLFAAYPMIPIVLIAATYPFLHLQIIAGPLNTPVVDVVAILGLLGWALRVLWSNYVHGVPVRSIEAPVLVPMLLFTLVALISAGLSWEPLVSLKYVARPMLFFYIAFILFPVAIINTPPRLTQVLWVLWGVGVLIALYGIYGLIAMDAQTIWEHRVVPLDLFGMNPLGANHNLIADVMVITIPIAYWLLHTIRAPQMKKVMLLSILLLVATALLTFSRSAWIALAVEWVALLVLYKRVHMKEMIKPIVAAALVAVPLAVYMFFFSTQGAVLSSNENRQVLNDVTVEMVREDPWFGAGPGNFINVLAENRLFIMEFGTPIDAHGFVQKTLSETGILGLAAFIGLVVSVVVTLYRSTLAQSGTIERTVLSISLFLMVVGSLFFQLFQTSYYVSKLWLPIGIALAAASLYKKGIHKDI